MIRTVFLDFDGTVFSHRSVSIPRSTIEALRKLRKNGIKVFFCTGRAPSEFKDFDLSELTYDGMILSNGQIVSDENDHIIIKKPIEGRLKEEIVSLYTENKIPMYIITEDALVLNHFDSVVARIQAAVSSPIPEIRDYQGEDIYMASAFLKTKEDVEKIYALQDLGEITWWHDGAIDIVPKGLSKANGIDEVLKYYDIDISETLAIGDGDNDAEMLKHCAIGIAMGNASDMTKDAADYVTDDIDEDGLANALKHFGLI